MRGRFIIMACFGAFSGAFLVVRHGLAAVASALALAGWTGLAAITVYHLLPLWLCALAWRTALDRPRPGLFAFFWFRWLRDSGNEILAMVPGAGELLGIRVMSLRGLEMSRAAAGTIVDLTMEMGGQVAFTVLGVALLAFERPGNGLVLWSALGTVILALLVSAFAAAQRLGAFGMLERVALRLVAELGYQASNSAGGIHAAIGALYRRRRALACAMAIHFVAWIVGAGEAALCFRLMGLPAGLATVVVLESLTYALRNAAFFVPGGVGVQEAGYFVLGSALGIGPEFAVALSFMKRGREIVLGCAGLALWHMVEGRSVWRILRKIY